MCQGVRRETWPIRRGALSDSRDGTGRIVDADGPLVVLEAKTRKCSRCTVVGRVKIVWRRLRFDSRIDVPKRVGCVIECLLAESSSMIPAVNSWQPERSSSSSSSLQVPLTPSYTSPRSAPKPPSLGSSIRAAFHRPQRPPSVRSAFSTSTSSSDNHQNHPYAQNRMAPIPVVQAHGRPEDEDDECPVCLEPLSFSFRLPGEKPHIVPECGHALHEVRSSFLPESRLLTPNDRHASPPFTGLRRVRAGRCLASPMWEFAASADAP